MKKGIPDKIRSYYTQIQKLAEKITVTNRLNRNLHLQPGVGKAVDLILRCKRSGNKLMFIGNGASAAISSHMAADFLKNAGIKATAFNDSPLLTCISNDLGYKHVFEKSIEMFAETGDILVAISSSGKSENILLGVKAARAKKARVITFSGFAKNNPLRKLGEINFYVPSSIYGCVEVLHHSICHFLLDTVRNIK